MLFGTSYILRVMVLWVSIHHGIWQQHSAGRFLHCYSATEAQSQSLAKKKKKNMQPTHKRRSGNKLRADARFMTAVDGRLCKTIQRTPSSSKSRKEQTGLTTPSFSAALAFHSRMFISSDPLRMYLLSDDHFMQMTCCMRLVWYTSLNLKEKSHVNNTQRRNRSMASACFYHV